MDSDDGYILVFEEEVTREEEESKHEDEGPSEPIKPLVIPETIERPNQLKYTLVYAKGHGEVNGTLRESKKPKIYSKYEAYMKKLIELDPSTFEEVVNHQEQKDTMNEE